MDSSGDSFAVIPCDSSSLSEFLENSEKLQDSCQGSITSVSQSCDYELMLREIDASRQKYDDLEEKFVNINSQLSICIEEITRLKIENNEYVRKVRDLEEQLKFAYDKKVELEAENTKLIRENCRKLYEESEYDALKECDRMLQSQVQQKISELEKKNNEIRNLTEKNIELSERNNQLTVLIAQKREVGKQSGKLKSEIFLRKTVNKVLRFHLHQLLLTLTRLCLLGAFLKTVITTWLLWKEDSGINLFKEGFFVFVVFGHFIGTLMVVFHSKVKFACGILFVFAIIQVFVLSDSWDLFFLVRNVSVVYTLFLLVQEDGIENQNAFTEISVFGQNKANNYLKLTNQLFVVFMFIMVLHLDMSFMGVIRNIISCTLMVHVIVGSKTKLSVLLLITWLIFLNCYINVWWIVTSNEFLRWFLMFKFFHTLRFVGILLIIYLRLNKVVIDERKKSL